MSPKICTFLLLLLGLALPALSKMCPEPGKLPPPCSCDDVYADDAELELLCSSATVQELEEALRHMDKEATLEVQLEDMNLGYLPSKIFAGLNVVRLDISHCKIESLAPPLEVPLRGLEETLRELVIISSFSEAEKPATVFSLNHLKRLKEIDVSYNFIMNLHDKWFAAPPPALETLVLSNNNIEILGENAFENLVNLKKLELDGNRFRSIKRSMLPKAGNRLEELDLDNNAFTSLPDDMFADMPALKILSIRTNEIRRLEEKVFKPIWSQLEVIDARGNTLQCDSAMEWLFHVQTEAALILGTCWGPSGRERMDLEDFINSKGQ